MTTDCRKALALDSGSVKGHYLLGLALLRSDDADEAVRHLDKALDLARGGNGGPTMVEVREVPASTSVTDPPYRRPASSINLF